MKKWLNGFIVGIIFMLIVGVSAAVIYNANEVGFTPSDTTWNVTNVEDAINDIKNNYVAKSTFVDRIWTYEYIGSAQEFDVPVNGTYKIELWGAQGNGGNNSSYGVSLGGKGAYTSGTIKLNAGTKLYVYVGNGGLNATTSASLSNSALYAASFNGGGQGIEDLGDANVLEGEHGFAGGGATDVRLVNGTWSDSSSLASRIMVAAGGGGGGWSGNGSSDLYYLGGGGAAGGLSGNQAPNGNSSNVVGTQTSGNAFGVGGNSTEVGPNGNNATGAGGGGYWGGQHGYTFAKKNSSGNGGSSYISGYTGCVAIQSESNTSPKSGCANDTTDINCSYHYSGYIFEDTSMKSGLEVMPTKDGTSTMTGNTGNGYAKITLVSVD